MGATMLQQLGLSVFSVELVAIAVLREFGVLITAIMLAGRSDSAFTAQIGAMRMQQEVDATAEAPAPPKVACDAGTAIVTAPAPELAWWCARADGTKHGPFVSAFPDGHIEISAAYREGLLDGTLKAQGHTPLSRQQANARPTLYTPELLNADISLTELAAGLRRHPHARLCFYGPPGSGKTAFAGWLADQLGKPLHSKRVSDLVAPYVGQTEQNLAEAFRQAEEEEAVLLLDEVDSFLQDRTRARAQWEVTAVNEMGAVKRAKQLAGRRILPNPRADDNGKRGMGQGREALRNCFGEGPGNTRKMFIGQSLALLARGPLA